MRCVTCAKQLPYEPQNGETRLKVVDQDTARLYETYLTALNLDFKKFRNALLHAEICEDCLGKLEKVNKLCSSADFSDELLATTVDEAVNGLKNSLRDGYLDQLERELTSENECPHQSLRLHMLKDLGLVVELDENAENMDVDEEQKTASVNSLTDIKMMNEPGSDAAIELSERGFNSENEFSFLSFHTLRDDGLVVELHENVENMGEEAPDTRLVNVEVVESGSDTAMLVTENNHTEFLEDSLSIQDTATKKKRSRKSPKKKRKKKKKSQESSPTSKLSTKLTNKTVQNSRSSVKERKPKNTRREPESKSKSKSSTSMNSRLKRSQVASNSKSSKNKSTKSNSSPLAENVDSNGERLCKVEVDDEDHGKHQKKPLPPINRKGEQFVAICKYEGCGRRYTDLNLREIHHKRIHEGDKNAYVCTQTPCTKRFCSKARLRKHMEKHKAEGKTYPCTHANCSEVLSTEQRLKFHLAKHTGVFPFRCDICQHGFQYAARMNAHMKLAHLTERTFECSICQRVFKSQQYLDIHLKNPHPPAASEDNLFKCDQCPLVYKRYRSLVEHQKTHIGDLPFACDQCDMKFPWAGRLTRHKKLRHLDIRPFECSICHVTFKQESNLRSHEARHDQSNKKFKCEVCGRLFFDTYKLKYHSSIHTNEKPFVCSFDNECKRAFRLESALKKHVAVVHEKDKKIICPICDMKFLTAKFLEYHQAAKHPELEVPKYHCDYEGCTKSYAEPSSLRVHKRSHTQDFPLSCEHCNFKALYHSRLKKHMMMKHAGSKKFKCTICSQRFTLQDYLRRHMERHAGTKRIAKNDDSQESDFLSDGSIEDEESSNVGDSGDEDEDEEDGCIDEEDGNESSNDSENLIIDEDGNNEDSSIEDEGDSASENGNSVVVLPFKKY